MAAMNLAGMTAVARGIPEIVGLHSGVRTHPCALGYQLDCKIQGDAPAWVTFETEPWLQSTLVVFSTIAAAHHRGAE